MARAAPLLVLAVMVATLWAVSPVLTFSQPPAETRRAALMGGLAAAAGGLVAAQPAQAAKFSFFGFGAEGSKAMSDPYAINDVDAYSPYSPFSGPSYGENLYKPYSPAIMEKKRTQIRLSEQILRERIPPAIATKNKEEVKQETSRQLYQLKDAMNYLADANKFANGDLAAENAVNKFRGEIQDLKVVSGLGKFDKANEIYGEMMNSLSEFKQLTGF